MTRGLISGTWTLTMSIGFFLTLYIGLDLAIRTATATTFNHAPPQGSPLLWLGFSIACLFGAVFGSFTYLVTISGGRPV